MRTLPPRHVAGYAVALAVVDTAVWWFTGYPEVVVGVALVVALVVLAGRSTREVGVSLVVAVLLAAFLVLALVTYLPRVHEPPGAEGARVLMPTEARTA